MLYSYIVVVTLYSRVIEVVEPQAVVLVHTYENPQITVHCYNLFCIKAANNCTEYDLLKLSL